MRCIRDLKFFLAAGIFVMSGIAISADAVEKKASPSVKISFPYIRQSGIAGNQFAVWVENANGQFTKHFMLQATREKAVMRSARTASPHGSGAPERQIRRKRNWMPSPAPHRSREHSPIPGTAREKTGKSSPPGNIRFLSKEPSAGKAVCSIPPISQSEKTLTRPGAAAVFREIRQSRQYDRNSDGNLHTIG